jgi:serine/threonine protein kinase
MLIVSAPCCPFPYAECFNEGERIYMIFQWAKGGDLFDKCCKVGRFSEEQALMIAVELLCAALYIHSRGILHRDIKVSQFISKQHHLSRF